MFKNETFWRSETSKASLKTSPITPLSKEGCVTSVASRPWSSCTGAPVRRQGQAHSLTVEEACVYKEVGTYTILICFVPAQYYLTPVHHIVSRYLYSTFSIPYHILL